MTIGEKIKEIRLKQNLKQSELAEKAKISRVAVGNYERGDRIPNTDILQAIATALGVKPYDLMSDTTDLTSMDNDTLNFLYGNPDLILLVDIFKKCGYRLGEKESIVNIYKGGKDPIAAVPGKEFIELGKDMLKYIQEFSDFEINKLIDNYQFLY